jgi:hypothetical protein
LGDDNDGLEIAGRCQDLVVLDGSAGAEDEPAVLLEAGIPTEVTLSGLTVTGGRYTGVWVDGGGLLLQGSAVGGNAGVLGPRDADRINPKLTLTGRFEALGFHQLKAGTDIEFDYFRTQRRWGGSSGYRYEVSRGFDPMSNTFNSSVFRVGMANVAGMDESAIQRDGFKFDVSSRALAFFAQDAYYPLPNLTFNLGLRMERQDLFWDEKLADQADAVTGDKATGRAVALPFLAAPRLGVVYDPTKEGRSKLYGHYGWYYQTVPLGTAMRLFAGERQKYDVYGDGQACGLQGAATSTPQCPFNGDAYSAFSGGLVTVVPGTRPSHVEEIVVGGEYSLGALVEDLTVGGSYMHRSLVDGLEDFSVDNAASYIWGNPGRAADPDELKRLEGLASTASDPDKAKAIRDRVAAFKQVTRYTTPKREFDALQLSVSKRFRKRWLAQGWYQFSRTKGDYPGLFSPDRGQLDPNMTSQYDLLTLQPNRNGALPQDRPHSFRVDGARLVDLGESSAIVLGASARGQSGTHPIYGPAESFLLPRGSAGRTPAEYSFDGRVGYRHKLQQASIEAYVDLLNLLNLQETQTVDHNYTFDTVDPIVDGRKADLRYAKSTSPFDPVGVAAVNKNPNYEKPTSVQLPMSLRLGVRGTF